jgi:hypothetical protein
LAAPKGEHSSRDIRQKHFLESDSDWGLVTYARVSLLGEGCVKLGNRRHVGYEAEPAVPHLARATNRGAVGAAAMGEADHPRRLSSRPEWSVGYGDAKNWLEVKAGRNIEIEGNTMASGTPTNIALTVRNQNGSSPWIAIDNLTVRSNELRTSGITRSQFN